MVNAFRIALVSGITALSLAAPSVVMGEDLSKKLINFGWDMLPPDRLEKKIGELQHLPFDGLTVRATDFCYPFFNKHVDGAAVEANVEAMSKIQWGKFTDNFMYLTAAAEGQWFDDQAWSNDGAIIKNVRAIARMGHAGRCKGILFDPEFVYWGQPAGPWQYAKQARHQEKSLEEYRGMVRQRGRQFIDAIEAEMPNPVFLSLFWGSLGSFRQLAYDTDPKIVNEVIGGEYYGLLHDFMLGVLEAADIGTTIIDGNESSYYANDYESYMSAYEYTIEHILPQNENLSPKWREALGQDWHRIQKTWLHTLGNLTLTAYNADYSDRPFSDKRDMPDAPEKGLKQSPLKLNQGLGALEMWNEEAIKTRAGRLADLAVGVWPAPSLSPEILDAYHPKVIAISDYTLDDHPNLLTSSMRPVFEAFRKELLALDPCVSEEFLKLYVAYKAETNFVDIIPQAKRMRLILNMRFVDVVDPKGICTDLTGMGNWGNGDVGVGLAKLEDLPYVIGLVRQSLELQLGNGTET